MIESGFRGIWIGGKHDESSWEWMRRLARYWDRVEELEKELGEGPWFVVVNKSGPVVKYP